MAGKLMYCSFRYVTDDNPSDLLIRVGGTNFHLHQNPMVSRSGTVKGIIEDSSGGSELRMIELDDIPGGPDAFMLAAKFCYGFAIDLTPSNIAGLRCASEYLDMTEDLQEGNLAVKTEAFLSYVVFSSWKNAVAVLKSCESLSPWAENLQIVRRCSESIAWKACARPKEMKRSSSTWSSSSEERSPRSDLLQAPTHWWFEDVSTLRADHFAKVVTAMELKGMRSDLIGAAIMNYASTCLPDLCKRATTDADGNPNAQSRDRRLIVESLVAMIPATKNCVPCTFLLRLLRTAKTLQVEPAAIMELEKRVGMQLEQANLPDLLLPSDREGEALYDIDLMQRLVEHFVDQERTEMSVSEKHGYGVCSGPIRTSSKAKVAELLDGYLAKVSTDRNLPLAKFKVLARALPESARTRDDDLYRAVDSYLKVHPALAAHERMRLCQVMDCRKLSVDACAHAVKNERLPIRFAIQLLFSKQVTMTDSIAGSWIEGAHPMIPTKQRLLLQRDPRTQCSQEGSVAAEEVNKLSFELENMKAKHSALRRDMDGLHRALEEMSSSSSKPTTHSSVWARVGRKLGKMKMSRTER
ncbi:unnamed protein product [Musa hybrid cultivar]